jgi:hypothetical protein
MSTTAKIIQKDTTADLLEMGLIQNIGRDGKLRLKRKRDGFGFDVYILENITKKEILFIPRFLFEFFRGGLVNASQQIEKGEFTEVSIEFKGKVKLRIESTKSFGPRIVAVDDREGAKGFITLSGNILKGLIELVHDGRIGHGSDVLKRILAYHKLFKFTFVEGSESLNSNLALRTDVLSQVEDYVPPVGRRSGRASSALLHGSVDEALAPSSLSSSPHTKDKSPSEAKIFKSRLAERDGGKAWKVDYQALFSGSQGRSVERQPKVNSGEESKKEGSPRHAWLIQLLSQEVKSLKSSSWRCEMSIDEMSLMRESFFEGGDSEFFLGFDICDAIYKTGSGKLKTFRFPLYYLSVDIQQSGRTLILKPLENARFYLNHLALATLVEAFTTESQPETGIENFFKALLEQNIEVDGRLGRIYLSRVLPCSETIFERTRDVLLGLPGENGKGGLLSDLEVLGIECDTDAVFLYKSSRDTNPLQRSLELDLAGMQDVAERSTERFIKTIPGKLLGSSTPSKQSRKPFCKTSFVPQFLPPSTRKLLDRLNHNDIVLLEGPPGTGKTHTIMNLLIHAICSGQRILIVSDQEAALHALTEKVEGYLLKGDDNHGRDAVQLWKQSVRILDRLQGGYSDLSTFCRTIDECLGLSQLKDMEFAPDDSPRIMSRIESIDREVSKVKQVITKLMHLRLGPDVDMRKRVSPKRGHETTTQDIEAFVAFLRFMGGGSDRLDKKSVNQSKVARRMLRQFMLGREYLTKNVDANLYQWFELSDSQSKAEFERLDQASQMISKLIKMSPKSVEQLKKSFDLAAPASRLHKHFVDLWMDLFPPTEGGVSQALRVISSLFHHPAKTHLKALLTIIRDQRTLMENATIVGPGVWRQLQKIHHALAPDYTGAIPLAVEVCRFTTSSSFASGSFASQAISIQECLETLETLEKKRTDLVKDLLIARLKQVLNVVLTSKEGVGSLANQLSSMLQGLKSSDTLDSGIGVWREFQEKLFAAFPIWLCRKQAVSFLFPCREKLFDLVIVDEATQCRVDDALPLMFRSKKVMVVGDDKQTVLAKNSVIDDYLFKEFNLDEHLRGTQARGIKGGGSHIFGLVKGIKEASVMLDEHYRCPPDIIEYSNKYVYNSDLRIMKWRRLDEPKSVVIDWSEKSKPESQRHESGAYKGLETDMIDRFFDFVYKSILEIESRTKKRINVETDVALCYFLLKNDPYVKAHKSKFLQRLDRGSDVLDGAGAALQGKERPYIFYYWDISRANMMAFRQGDDPDKRKGELNVLMSRPQKQAFHFLHKYFDSLDHDKASIADYLWKTWQRQSEGDAKVEYSPRIARPGPVFIPWRRSSGQLMTAILQELARVGHGIKLSPKDIQTSVVVGDPRLKVDVVINRPSVSLGIVDLSAFEWHERCADDVVDYYFQLQRADPKISPVFIWMHELADSRSRGFIRLLSRFSKL